jgi:hypothetical protein
MKMYGDVSIHIFLTSALIGGDWSASRPGRFTQGETTRGTHWMGCWVGTRTSLDDVEKKKFVTLPGLELRHITHPAHSQSLYRLWYASMNKYVCLTSFMTYVEVS